METTSFRLSAVPAGILSGLLPQPRYRAHFTRTREEIERALRLRYEVFNLELGEGLERSCRTGLDEDEFDSVCDHLVVTEEISGHTVGTYRLQTGGMASRGLGYYSAREFDFSPYQPLRASLIELGRACVHKEHRNFAVISLLWKEIVRYALDRGARYLAGCSSLSSQDPALGLAMYRRLAGKHLAPPALRTGPLPEFALPEVEPLADCPPPPKLLRAYLGVGAWICGHPAIDREFGTIDFLTLLDCCNGTPAAAGHFAKRPRADEA